MGKSSKPQQFKAPVKSVLLAQVDYPDVIAAVNEYARLADVTPTHAASQLLLETIPERIAGLREERK